MNRIVVFFLVGFSLASPIAATDLRGRVDGTHGYAQQPFPLAGAHITLFSQNQGGGYTEVANTISGPDGIYYFKNIKPGTFFLQINGRNYSLVVRDTPSQDVAPILLHF